MADNDPPPVTETEIVVTMIGRVMHRWIFWPGTWVPYDPKPGDLLRVWQDRERHPPTVN